MTERDRKQSKVKELVILLIVVPLILPILAIAIVVAVVWFVWGAWLGLQVRLRWYPTGKKALFVYSNSPNWKEYIETNILPRIDEKAVVINWSERSQWDWGRKPLEVQVFRHWAGVNRNFFKGKVKWDGDAFNPIAITFIPWWRRKVFRFWQPFKDFKHGKEKPLKELEAKLFEVLS